MRSVILTGVLMVNALAGAAHAQARWTFERMTDPMNDQVRGIATVRSGDYTLIVKCDYGMGVYATMHARQAALERNYLGETRFRGSTSIMLRFGSGQPTTVEWEGTDGYYGNFDYEDVAMFARDLMSADRLAIRIPERRGRYADVTFPLTGSRAAITNVYRACGKPVP